MKHIKKWNESFCPGYRVSIQDQLNSIDNESKFKYYVGYIKKRPGIKHYAWSHNGVFQGFSTHEEVLTYIDKLKSNGIPEHDIKIVSPKEYKQLQKYAEQ